MFSRPSKRPPLAPLIDEPHDLLSLLTGDGNMDESNDEVLPEPSISKGPEPTSDSLPMEPDRVQRRLSLAHAATTCGVGATLPPPKPLPPSNIPTPLIDFLTHQFLVASTLASWAELPHMDGLLLQSLIRDSFCTLTPVQTLVPQLIQAGYHVLCAAPTGSGKTLSFLVPLIIYVLEMQQRRPDSNACAALVLTPTRELALQIHGVLGSLQIPKIRAAILVGGVAVVSAQDANVVVAVPGRLIGHLTSSDTRASMLKACSLVVLDELDQLLDTGFSEQLCTLLRCCARDAQVVGMTATLSSEALSVIQKLKLLDSSRPAVCCFVENGLLQANPRIAQLFIEYRSSETGLVVEDVDYSISALNGLSSEVYSDKLHLLLVILSRMYCNTIGRQTLIFTGSQEAADTLAENVYSRASSVPEYRVILQRGIGVFHAGKRNDERMLIIDRFRAGKIGIGIVTSGSGRGLDFPDVYLVINYDFPSHAETYTHQIGRTARGAHAGTAITLADLANPRPLAGLVCFVAGMRQRLSPAGLRAANVYLAQQRLEQHRRFTPLVRMGNGYAFKEMSSKEGLHPSLRIHTPNFIYPRALRYRIPREYHAALAVAARLGLCPEEHRIVTLDITEAKEYLTQLLSSDLHRMLYERFNVQVHVTKRSGHTNLTLDLVGESEIEICRCIDYFNSIVRGNTDE
ncbi:putative RNA-dependent helicase p68 [Giardia muris]|uniref:ATP-dependent RNA helicase n=1 Tax=Giardia muris TaxID=5742 RepID=A0A4Z1T954_GIAMU|nr:putative RNA-dependent helicase p68 [Giardia muris]|eukprot:TNJ29059.1 putative RNA-dependent helicase p68 [Giardia muris]